MSLKRLFFSFILSLIFIYPSWANERLKVSSLNYDRLDALLREIVVVQNGDARKVPNRRLKHTGSRILRGNTSVTRLQSNRILFKRLQGDNLTYILLYRRALEKLPSLINFRALGRDGRISYWLNLRNVYAIEKLAAHYPARQIKGMWQEISMEKGLRVAGESLSIKDVEDKLMALYPYPRIIYGFYNGAIGGPNMRNKAFSGQYLSSQLDKLEDQFINSLRGVQFWDDTLKVSDFYLDYQDLFDDFATDLKKHVLPNLKRDLRRIARRKRNLSFDISDWYLADVPDTALENFSSASIAPAALFDLADAGVGSVFIKDELKLLGDDTVTLMGDFSEDLQYRMINLFIKELTNRK